MSRLDLMKAGCLVIWTPSHVQALHLAYA
jgi:hypothetical protein